jgi:predicted ATPase
MNKIVISGGPGSGKSTLLYALESKGYSCVSEVSRKLIRQQEAVRSGYVPWKDLAGFARICLDHMISDFESASSENLTFFDRGIPDIIAYLLAGGLPVDDPFYNAAEKYRYAPEVFIAPPWKAIYINDPERWQTYEEASALYERITAVYLGLGYRISELPLTSVAERTAFVLTKTNELKIY